VCIASNLKKISICALTFVVIGVLDQHSVRALTTASTPATLLTESYLDVGSSLTGNTLSVGEVTDESNSQTNELILLGFSKTDEIIQASQVTQVTVDATSYYITKESAATQQTYTPAYRNTYANITNASSKRKVPEPSTLLGLIALISWFATQRRNSVTEN
jgi:hypothetical protein